MKTLRLLSFAFATFALSILARAEPKNCGCACCKGKPVCCCVAEAPEESTGHPLRGVVTNIMPELGALLVKHEEIPGVMKAMTMLLRVDEPTLKSARKGQAITATLYRKEGDWWLRDVAPAGNP